LITMSLGPVEVKPLADLCSKLRNEKQVNISK
jgi:hypothetical protein